MKINAINFIQSCTALMIGSMLLIACSKSSDEAPEKKPEEPVIENPGTDNGLFYKLIRVQNFKGDTTNSDHTSSKASLFYSLEQNVARTPQYEKTRGWDIAFGGLYASFMSGNNGSDSKNHGSGTKAVGGILILKEEFSKVVDVPADDQFNTASDLYGTDIEGDYGEGTGWYLYDFGGTFVRDGAYDNMHIAYALGSPLTLKSGKVIPARTLVVRTANGNYAKIKMISVYKDVFTADKWFRTTPHMYFTFEYVMVPKGSKKFEIK